MLSRVKTDIPRKYVIVRWIVFLFLAAAINAITIFFLIDTYRVYTSLGFATQQDALTKGAELLGPPLVIGISLPILASVFLTHYLPERKVVPPLYIQAVSWSYVLVVGWYYFPRPDYFYIFLTALYYALFLGLLQDKVAIRLTGIAAPKELMIGYSFTAHTKMEDIEDLLMIRDNKNNLYLFGKPEHTSKGRICRGRDSNYRIIIELRQITTEKGIATQVNAVYYDKGRYALMRDGDLEVFAKKQAGFLKQLIEEKYSVVPDKEESTEDLKEYARDTLSGVSHRMQSFTTHDKIRFAVYAALLIPVVFYFVQKAAIEEGSVQPSQIDLGIYGIIAAIAVFFAAQAIEWAKIQAERYGRR